MTPWLPWIVPVVLIALCNEAISQSESRLSQEGNPANQCGPNCLYLFLKLQSHNVDFQGVRNSLTVTSEGCSLYDLKLAANSLGSDAEVVRCTPNELTALRSPTILHLRNPTSGGTKTGHFVLLLSSDSDGLHVIDGTTGLEETWEIQSIQDRNWSGYALMAGRGSWALNIVAAFSVLLGCISVLWIIQRSSRR